MKTASCAAALVLIAGCASTTTTPTAPGILALPGTGKSFDQFRYDDQDCRGHASAMVGGKSPSDAQSESTGRGMVAGAAIGTLAGALLTGQGSGAAVGAGFGLLTGAAVGSSSGNATAYSIQRSYDAAFTQCMYGKGHKVPGTYVAPRARPATVPPPPPGLPPPEAPPDYKKP